MSGCSFSNSSGTAETRSAQGIQLRNSGMVAFVQRVRIIFYLWSISLCGAVGFCAPVRADKLRLTPETLAVAGQIYSGDLERDRGAALRLQQELPEHPVGYLLEPAVIAG